MEKDRAGGKAEMSRQRGRRDISATRFQWRGLEDRVRRLGMDCFSEAASTGTQEDGIWRRTVPVARLQCRQWRRAATAKETAAGECAEMRAVGAAEEFREDASGTARRCQGGCKWCSQIFSVELQVVAEGMVRLQVEVRQQNFEGGCGWCSQG